MPLYVGEDLHSSNNFLAICDHHGKRISQKKLKKKPGQSEIYSEKEATWSDSEPHLS